MVAFNSFNRSFNSNRVLDNDALRRAAPAVFAEAPHSKMSERYSFLPTIQIVDALRTAGWQVMQATQGRVRDLTRHGVQRHMLRLRHPDMQLRNVGDTIPELVLVNSHDGSSASQLHAGLFRLVCSNGLILADATFAKMSIRHSNTTIGEVVDASFQVVKEVPQIASSVESMRSVTLAAPERQAFAAAAASLRWDTENGTKSLPVEPAQLLQARRYDDNKADLWTTMNVVQENIIRGGVRGKTSTGKRQRTRAVASVTEDTRLNKAIWQLAEEMKRIKSA